MANGYIDLGTWYGVTPFVGGGVGTAFHHLQRLQRFRFRRRDGRLRLSPRTRHTTTLAWAAMAGLGYSVTPEPQARDRLPLHEPRPRRSGAVTCINDPDCGGAVYKIKDITSHDVRIGMRWLLGGVVAPAIAEYQPEPAPLVRKY